MSVRRSDYSRAGSLVRERIEDRLRHREPDRRLDDAGGVVEIASRSHV